VWAGRFRRGIEACPVVPDRRLLPVDPKEGDDFLWPSASVAAGAQAGADLHSFFVPPRDIQSQDVCSHVHLSLGPIPSSLHNEFLSSQHLSYARAEVFFVSVRDGDEILGDVNVAEGLLLPMAGQGPGFHDLEATRELAVEPPFQLVRAHRLRKVQRK
jgi:hypothetical protein